MAWRPSRIVGWLSALLLACTMASGAGPRVAPPEVAAVLSKLGGNRPLTAAELTRLTAYYGGASALPPGGLELAPDEDDEDAPITFEPLPAAQLAAVAAPSREAYLALVKEVKALYAARMSPDGRAQIGRASCRERV